MYINIDVEYYKLKDFLLSDATQVILELKVNDFIKKEFFAIKIKDKSGLISIIVDVKSSERDTHYLATHGVTFHNEFIFLLSWNPSLKAMIVSENFDPALEDIQDEFKGEDINIFKEDDLLAEIIKDGSKIYEEIISKIAESEPILYSKEYEKALKNLKLQVQESYLSNPDIYYNLRLPHIFFHNDLYLYIEDKNSIISIIQDKVNGDMRDSFLKSLIINEYTELRARRYILKELKENPSKFVKRVIKVRDAISTTSKDYKLTIITDDGGKYKVPNKLYGKYSFKVSNTKFIDINNVKQIKYGNKILLDLTKES